MSSLLNSTQGHPAEAPGRLALVTVMQFGENLSDRQVAEAARARIDWKYALGLDLTDPGFDYSLLSEFRQRLLEGGQEQALLDTLLAACQQRAGSRHAGGNEPTQPTSWLRCAS